MRSFLLHKTISILVLFTTVFVVGALLFPSYVGAQAGDPPEEVELPEGEGGGFLCGPICALKAAILGLPATIALTLLGILQLILWIAGMVLNSVIQFTVVDMKDNINETGINVAWGAVRDVANMSFIFILLYAAIKTIVGAGGEMRKTIVSVIVVAILINFSLFMTKVVIDASNVVAIAFYDAVAPGALADDGVNRGISNTLMNYLGIQSLYSSIMEGAGDDFTVDFSKIITISIVGSIFVLIAIFIFMAVSVMFIIRFVVLIFVMILSPIAFLAYALPELKDRAKKWTDALFSQALFAPVYFLLMWLVLVLIEEMFPLDNGGAFAAAILGTGEGSTFRSPSPSDLKIIMDFVIIIAFLIASLIIAKEISSKGGGMISSANKWAGGFAGGATFGMGGRLGRGTVGRVGASVGESERLKERATQGGVGGMAARLTLAAGRKTSKASFDVRGTPLGGTLEAGQATKGGFAQTLKDKKKKEKDFADSLKPSDELVTDAERAMERARRDHGAGSQEWFEAQERVDELKGVDEKEAIQRLRDRGMTEADAGARVKANRAQYITKSLGDTRKENLVESIEKSPTYVAANQVRKATDRVGGWVDTATNRPANVVRRTKVYVARKIPRGAIRNLVRTMGTDVEGVVRSPGDMVRSLPNLIRAKNMAAIAEIRKGKKSARELFDEAITAAGGVGGTTPPAGAAPPIGGTPPAGGTPAAGTPPTP